LQIKQVIRQIWEEKPLVLILFAGILFRTLAVIFSKGFVVFDDEFLVLDPAQSWVFGHDYNYWITGKEGITNAPDGPSIFYPGLHYLLFKYLNWRGMTDPQHEMYIVRALHAMWSLITIVAGYKITEQYAGKKVARQAGMMLSILWILPMLSVHNMVEVVCIPPLMLATWFMVDPKRNIKATTFLWIGFFCGLAFNIRFQTLLFSGGLGLVILWSKKWKNFIFFSIAFLLTVSAIQGAVDWFIWGRPFTEFREYIHYNLTNSGSYPTGGFFKYFGVVGGMILPPVGIFMLVGFFRSFRKYPILFIPSFLFFLFHSIFPNKQERFIMPVLPFFIILGCIGWYEYAGKSAWWQKHNKFLKGCWTFFWIVNCILLPFLSVHYSKRSRVESMTYLSHQKDLKNYMVEESFGGDVTQTSFFYGNRWDFHPVEINNQKSLYKAYLEHSADSNPLFHPNYVLFYGIKNIDARVGAFKKMFPTTTYQTTITPSFLDWLIYKLNPINKNETVYIYKFDDKIVNLPDSVMKK
jgi:hypothetical protein